MKASPVVCASQFGAQFDMHAEDPLQVALKQLKRVAPTVGEEQAKEALEAVLGNDASLKDNIVS